MMYFAVSIFALSLGVFLIKKHDNNNGKSSGVSKK